MEKWSSEIERLLAERFGHDSLISLATAVDNVPHVRTVNSFYLDGSFYVLTHGLSGKMAQLRQNPVAAISGDWFTGHARAVDMGSFRKEENRELAAKMLEVFAEWIHNGHSDLEDEQTVILRLELTEGVLLSHGTRYTF